jgi:nucleotide-binding universal stress UspA family protein
LRSHDFSEAADLAVRYAAAFAEHHGAGLHLLHVLEHAADLVHHPDFSGTGEVAHAYFERLEREEDFDRLEREVAWEQGAESKPQDADASVHQFFETLRDSANRELEAVGHEWCETLEVRRVVRYGHPAEQTCEYAARHSIDLLVLGSHGRSRLKKSLLGSTVERVLRLSRCPVLVVRHPEHDHVLVD